MVQQDMDLDSWVYNSAFFMEDATAISWMEGQMEEGRVNG
jgi:hypothetical protein